MFCRPPTPPHLLSSLWITPLQSQWPPCSCLHSLGTLQTRNLGPLAALSAETLAPKAMRLTSSAPSNLCSDVTFWMRPTPIKNCRSVLSPTFLIPSPCFIVSRIYHLIYDANCSAWPNCKVHESMRMDVFVLISTTSPSPARVTSAEQLFDMYLLNEWMESIYTNKQSRMASRLGELSMPDAAFMSWAVSLVLTDRYRLRFRVKLQGPSRLAHRLLSSLLICFASGQRQGH